MIVLFLGLMRILVWVFGLFRVVNVVSTLGSLMRFVMIGVVLILFLVSRCKELWNSSGV